MTSELVQEAPPIDRSQLQGLLGLEDIRPGARITVHYTEWDERAHYIVISEPYDEQKGYTPKVTLLLEAYADNYSPDQIRAGRVLPEHAIERHLGYLGVTPYAHSMSYDDHNYTTARAKPAVSRLTVDYEYGVAVLWTQGELSEDDARRLFRELSQDCFFLAASVGEVSTLQFALMSDFPAPFDEDCRITDMLLYSSAAPGGFLAAWQGERKLRHEVLQRVPAGFAYPTDLSGLTSVSQLIRSQLDSLVRWGEH